VAVNCRELKREDNVKRTEVALNNPHFFFKKTITQMQVQILLHPQPLKTRDAIVSILREA
jgi:hypothetical protein